MDTKGFDNVLEDDSKAEMIAETFLFKHGIKLDTEKPSTSGVLPSGINAIQSPEECQKLVAGKEPKDVVNRSKYEAVKNLEKNVNKMLSQLQNELFGEEPIEDIVPENEILENLAKEVQHSMCQDKTQKKMPCFKDRTSLLYKYSMPDKEASKSEGLVRPSTYLAGLEYLENALKECEFITPSSEDNLSDNKVLENDPLLEDAKSKRKKKKVCTVEQMAEIFATVDDNLKETSEESAQSNIAGSVVTSESGVEAGSKTHCESSEGTDNIKASIESAGVTTLKSESVLGTSSSPKKTKKENEYEPKKVDISWSDPRNDPEFMRELEEIMNCDSIDFKPKQFDIKPEIDDMAEEFSSPCLPRNILSILNATENDFLDWEYSIKLEHVELSDSEDSEEDENIQVKAKNALKELTKEEKSLGKGVQSSSTQRHYDLLELLQLVNPPVIEDIIAVRDDMGNIFTYESVPRSDEHLTKEYERVYLDKESETEDEEAEEENEKDEADPDETEITWEKDRIKGSLDGGAEEADIISNLNRIQDTLELCDANSEELTPELKEQMDKVNELLDLMGVPRAGEIEFDAPAELMKKEAEKISHVFEAHKNKLCPPGVVEVEANSEDEEDAIYRNLSKETESVSSNTIDRPALLHLKFELDGEEGDLTANVENSNDPSTSTDAPLFDDDDDDMLNTDELNEIPDIFAEVEKNTKENTEDDDDDDEGDDDDFDLPESKEYLLDAKFEKEYFRRGGTMEGLGLSESEEEENLELETLENFSKKFLTFPYMSKQGSINFVRARRIIAENFPELRDVAFADLSKYSLELHDSEDSSSDSCEFSEKVHFKEDPFDFDDVPQMEPNHISSSKDESWLTADENDESECESVPALELINQGKMKSVKKERKKRRKAPSITVESSDSEEESTPTGQTVNAFWTPISQFESPTSDAVVNAMETLNGVLKPPPRFRRPKRMKAWLKGEYTPSRQTIKNWKKAFLDYYGDVSLLTKINGPKEQSDYENFLTKIRNHPLFKHDEQTNHILIFKRMLEEAKRKNEEQEKADEVNVNTAAKGDITVVEGEERRQATVRSESSGSKQEAFEENVKEVKQEKLDNKVPVDEAHSVPVDIDNIKESEAEPPKTPVIRLRDGIPLTRKEEWAEELNCNANSELNVNPAMKFPFELDGFQREAINALENGYNVFVSAHTSAGKTVVAEYAIAMSKKNRSKAVYTSPVKALSNQKYADFKRIFGSVGLITGDIQLNENAECLIMTTEILRSMLYNSSEKIRDLEFVVFDEVHYINDPERGHVWEEVLILLPSQVQIVMLSATVPNTLEFANWVGRTKQRKVMVCATHNRPVPLNHYLYTGTGGSSPGSTYALKSGDGPFIWTEYEKATVVMKAMQETEKKNKRKQFMKRMEEEKAWKSKGFPGKPPIPPGEDMQSTIYKKDQTMWIALISFLVKKDWLPAVSFVFSRKKCDSFANMLFSIDLTTNSEKSFIHKFIKSQIEKLDDVDQDLPQIQIMKRQLDKGIGVHHSGILPVMKEIVEVLFQEGKVKLLFATETFAMGVNMPARTVVFYAIRKFDGNETRLLQPAEYVQMAGRAGRRGKDAAGNVLILSKPSEVIPRSDLETLLYGNPCKLISKFRLSYRMILNTLTVSGMLTVENMMERSFCENHGQMKKKFMEKDLVEAEQAEQKLKKSVSNSIEDSVVDILAKFYDLAISFVEEWFQLRVVMLSHSKILKEINPGRLIRICMGSFVNRTALVISSSLFPNYPARNSYKVMIMDQNSEFERTIAPDGHEMSSDELEMWYRMVALMDELPSEIEILSGPNDYSIQTVRCHNIVGVYKEAPKFPKNMFEDFLNFINTKSQQFSRHKTCDAGDAIARILYSYSGKFDIVDETLISYDNFELGCRAMGMWSTFEAIQTSRISATSPLVMKAFRRVFRWKQALRKVDVLKFGLSAENMILYPDFRSKMELLKEKRYISSSEQVLMKGFMAARIGKYELIVCEMLVENILSDLLAEEVAALLSFLVYQSSSEDSPIDESLPEGLKAAIEKCKKLMDDVTALERKYDIRDFEGSEISKLKFGLVPIMYHWAKQEPLKNIMSAPMDFDFQEGLLVRWIQQLLETLKEVEAAARIMGDPTVPNKLQEAGQCIKRGIVFAPSLYTTMV